MPESTMTGNIIEVRITRIEQLFNSFDPSPFNERDLDADAESHIAGWARELSKDMPISILVHMPAGEAVRAEERGLASALANYFKTRSQWIERDKRELFRLGWRYLSISVPVLIFCLLASQIVPEILGSGPLAKILQESLVIIGWVANWKPLETFLYDWWPLERKAVLYRRIASANIEFRAV